MSTDHPLHPATVHFPIAFLLTSYGIDALQPLIPSLPAAIASFLPPAVELTRISYYALSLGLLTAVPAVMSGTAQAVKMVQKQGIYEADKKTIKAKVKATIAHAAMNDFVIFASAYSWWCRKHSGALNVGYKPESWMIGASVVLLTALLYAANIGGSLTYNYGLGVSIAKGKGKSQ